MSSQPDLHERRTRLSPEQRARFVARLHGAESSDAGRSVIPRRAEGEPLILSFAQQRQWFLWKLDEQSTAYHMPLALELTGQIDEPALESAFVALVRRHESLRTIFRPRDDGGADAVIQPPGAFVLARLDVGDSLDPPKDAAQAARRIALAPFDLSAGPLFRVTLIRQSAHSHVLVMSMHHIVSDGWSMQLIVNEFVELYRARREGREALLAPLPIRYQDYAAWQRNWLEASEQESQLRYWRSVLGDEHPVLQLSTDFPRPADRKYRAVHHSFELPADLTEGLNRRARANGATLFMVLLGGLQVLLHRYAGVSDLRVGVNNAGRHRPETHGVVGIFINTQIIRTQIDDQMNLGALLLHVREAVLASQEHQDLPFEQLVDALQPERSLSHNPLFQILMDHQRRDHSGRLTCPGLIIHRYALGDQAAKFELMLSTEEYADGRIVVSFTYAQELFEPETVARLGAHYSRILQTMAECPDQLVRDVTLLSQAEQALLRQWSAGKPIMKSADDSQRGDARREIQPRPRRKISSRATATLFGPSPGGGHLPVQCSADTKGSSLKLWMRGHRHEIDAALGRHGAILFRGFDVTDAAAFNACINAVSGHPLQYTFRSSPRTQVDPGLNIYTSTDYPAQEKIFPHNESSYCAEFPLQLFFYCQTPALAGGETPICDTRALLRKIDPDVRDAFIRKKVMYVRNFGDGLGLSWQAAFQTQSREAVERYCAAADIAPQWLSDGRLRTRRIGPAVIRHPITGELSWFNHATFFNVLTLPESVRDALVSGYAPDELPQNTFYGDGSEIEPEVIEHLQRAYRNELTQFSWQQGDVLMVDNVSVAHARNEFAGPRRILVGMAGTGMAAELEFSAREFPECEA